jgi:hypothetical protein
MDKKRNKKVKREKKDKAFVNEVGEKITLFLLDKVEKGSIPFERGQEIARAILEKIGKAECKDDVLSGLGFLTNKFSELKDFSLYKKYKKK